MKYLIGLFLGVWIVSVMVMFVNQSERNECHKWNEYAKESVSMGLKSYSWQKAQCAAHNINLNY